ETSRPPRMVAGSPTGCTEALLCSNSADVLVELIDIGLRSWDRSWDRTMIDTKVRQTDAGSRAYRIFHEPYRIFHKRRREDTMKSRLLLLTGIAALAFVGPINASAATIDIADFTEVGDPSFTQSGFTLFNTIARVQESVGIDGVLALSGTYIAANPLAAGVVQTFNFNMNDPVEDGPI